MGSEEKPFSFAASVSALGLVPADRVLVAFSGGPDSTYLLLAALAYFGKNNVEVAYVDYHDSPAAADEARIVTAFTSKYGLVLHRRDVELPASAAGFEARARAIRYGFFAELVLTRKLAGVLVAHQRNDDAETYAMQKDRHGIVNTLGLAPLAEVNHIKIYRPLLGLTKAAIEKALAQAGITYFDDPTNRNPRRVRDRLRMGILADEKAVAITLAERDSRQDQNAREGHLATAFLAGSSFGLVAYRAFAANVRRRICYGALRKLLPQASGEHVAALANLAFEYLKGTKTGSIAITGRIWLYKSSCLFFFAPPIGCQADYSYEIDKPGVYVFEWAAARLDKPLPGHIGSFPVWLRNVAKGDRIGTGLETKDAWSFIRKEKVPGFLRGRYPALFDRNGLIVYIPFYADVANGTAPVSPAMPRPLLPASTLV